MRRVAENNLKIFLTNPQKRDIIFILKIKKGTKESSAFR